MVRIALVPLLITEEMAGDVMSFHVFGQVIVVLNSVKATNDLLERCGDIYSDHPAIPICEMCVIDFIGLPWRFIDKNQDEVGMARTACGIHGILASDSQAA